MPLQNRVAPDGDLLAVPDRGTMFGNRGLLHDAERRIVRQFQVRRWLICVLEFRGRHRQIMRPGHYTELFFLDEATALAAGHRPCAECRRPAYEHYRRCWVAGHGVPAGKLPTAGEMDDILHRDRLTAARVKRTYCDEIATLPDGIFMVHDDEPWLIWSGALLHWTPGGYDRRLPRPSHGQVTILTPRATVRAIAAGYAPIVHMSARAGVPIVGQECG